MKRRPTREVHIGSVKVGQDHPIRIQSMTTSPTRDVQATMDQIMRLADMGCEIARVTVQGVKEAEACHEIKNGLIQKGYSIPLVADIHFYPKAAMQVVEYVDKVRINPGNFVDKRATFKVIEYDEITYAEEIEKIGAKFAPLVLRCLKLKKAIRIGVNHGSLSDRIMNRYGDTPAGMVESALEFTRVCRKFDFHDIIFSMKASNTLVMIEAYRLLVRELDQLGWNYPLHLGVTEAGEGEDGRVKSAIGIGSLLLDGIGDTIRVSLTEDPWLEIDPCKRLIAFTQKRSHYFPTVAKISRSVPSPFHQDGSVVLSIEEEKIAIPKCDAVFVKKGRLSSLQLKGTKVLYPDRDLVIVDEDFSRANAGKTIFFAPKKDRVNQGRKFFAYLEKAKLDLPVILYFSYECSEKDLIIAASTEFGALLTDGYGEGLAIGGHYYLEVKKRLSFSILQGCRKRTVKTEFISCPGCGRTLFDLQKTAERIRVKTGHLPGVKIAIMGCVVNGPGEMADADFGYVGTKPGKIDLYVGKTVVEKDIDMEVADERLIDLIKAHGRWIESTSK
ncbi:MAG: (E)-4-hydroxy-3-methylbut-2-enyl-diphosphate synthase [Chlamydiia bacterium]|nr:(E)-4-hydroxy-3-methylbut-2-enyl-diphosphate synthase [Chlamydiia bacterium]